MDKMCWGESSDCWCPNSSSESNMAKLKHTRYIATQIAIRFADQKVSNDSLKRPLI